MNTSSKVATGLFLVELDNLKRNWGWYLPLGILLILLGVVAIGSSMLMTIVSVEVFGWLLIVGGAFEAVHAFWRKEWGGFFLDLLAGILYLVVGFMLVANPAASAVTLTLLIAMFLIVSGIFRVVSCVGARPPHWGWLLLSGALNLLLDALIWQQWPVSGLWVIGLFVGIEMLLNGWSLVMLSISAKNLPIGEGSIAATSQPG